MALGRAIIGSFWVIKKNSGFIYCSMWKKAELQQQVLTQAIKDFNKKYGVNIGVKWISRHVATVIKPSILAGENINMVDQFGGLVADE